MSAYHERLARESRDQRRNLAYFEGVFAFVLLITTLLAWENHPRTVADPHRPGSTIVHEVSHTMGAVTYPAGVLIAVLAFAAILWSSHLTSGKKLVGWTSLARSVVILSIMGIELNQLLLGRRNWQDHHPSIINPSLANAVGTGVWLGLAAAAGLVTVSLIYVWRVYRSGAASSPVAADTTLPGRAERRK